MKYLIYISMVVILASYVNAQGFGDDGGIGESSFGEFTPTPGTTTSGGGGGTLGVSCPGSTINLFGNCLNITFAEFTNFFKNMFSSGGVLEYKLLTQKQAVAGDIINITNYFVNEGKESVEINCNNFLDVNKNALMENEEPLTRFSKLAEPQIKNYYNVTLDVPDNLPEGSYLIGGRCLLLNSNMPNATAGNKIKILQSDITNKIKLPSINPLSKLNISLNQIIWIIIIILFIFVLFKSGLMSLFIGWIQTVFALLIATGIVGIGIVILLLIYLYFKYWRG